MAASDKDVDIIIIVRCPDCGHEWFDSLSNAQEFESTACPEKSCGSEFFYEGNYRMTLMLREEPSNPEMLDNELSFEGKKYMLVSNDKGYLVFKLIG